MKKILSLTLVLGSFSLAQAGTYPVSGSGEGRSSSRHFACNSAKRDAEMDLHCRPGYKLQNVHTRACSCRQTDRFGHAQWECDTRSSGQCVEDKN